MHTYMFVVYILRLFLWYFLMKKKESGHKQIQIPTFFNLSNILVILIKKSSAHFLTELTYQNLVTEDKFNVNFVSNIRKLFSLNSIYFK